MRSYANLVHPQILGVWWSCDRPMPGPFPAPPPKPGKSALGTRLDEDFFRLKPRELTLIRLMTCTTTYDLNSIRSLGPKLWNSLTDEIRASCNLKTFRNVIRNHILIRIVFSFALLSILLYLFPNLLSLSVQLASRVLYSTTELK